jgi:IS605 OrfB family transposase
LAATRHHLDQGGLSEDRWRQRWEASRWFITADGEAGKAWGNETIRWHPEQRWLEVKLPGELSHLANAHHGRYRLGAPVSFPYRGDEVAARAGSGSVRYDIAYDPDKDRWHLDASWKNRTSLPPALDELRRGRVLAVDLNAGHLAVAVVDASGNPVGAPATISLDLAGLTAPTRDGRLRAAISELVALAKAHSAEAVVVEDLDFAEAREAGREHTGRRPWRGRRGRSFRRVVAGIPTAKFRDRLNQMASNAGLAVIAVDPAYTSRWGAEHWLGALRDISPDASGHHAAALVIARRGLAQRARRRERCDWSRPEDRRQRATNSTVRPTPAPTGLSEQRNREPETSEAPGQPHQRRKTRPAGPAPRETRTPKTVRGAPRSTVPSATS